MNIFKYIVFVSYFIFLHNPAVNAMDPSEEDHESTKAKQKTGTLVDQNGDKRTAVEIFGKPDLDPYLLNRLEAYDRNEELLADTSWMSENHQRIASELAASDMQLNFLLETLNMESALKAKKRNEN